MATTLVAMFDSMREAEDARDKLQQEGLAAGSVHVTAGSSMSGSSASDTSVSGSMSGGPDAGNDTSEHRGFFSRLFGLGEDHQDVDVYSQGLQRGGALLTVTLPDDSQTTQIETLLTKAGAVDINERAELWRGSQGSQDMQSTQMLDRDASLRTGDASMAGAGDTLKVVQEELQVGKRAVETGGVRVRQYVTERPVQEQIALCEERAVVQRRPVDRVVSSGELASMNLQDREIEVRERSEEAVVNKQARIVEEVEVGKQARERTETIEDTVRRTDVDVEQLSASNAQRQPGVTRTTPPTI